jgi:replicative DNA helicase
MMNPDLFQPDTETAVLSIILQNPSKIDELNNVKDQMFTSGPNQVLFATIKELCSQGLVPEVNLIDSFLKSQGRDMRVGGRDYLNHLYKQVYNPDNLKEFERQLVESYKARRLLSLSAELPDKVKESKDLSSVIESIRKNLDSLTQDSGGELTTTFSTALRTSWDKLVYRVANPGISGVTTGLKSIDTVTNGMGKGDLWIIAGRPGMGKTAVMCNLLLQQAKATVPTLIFSLEMPEESLIMRMLSIETELSSSDLKLGLVTKEKLEFISATMRLIKDYPIFIDTNYNTSLAYIVSTIRRYVNLHNVRVAYIDYVQLLAERSVDATNELGRISRALKLLANELGITIIIGSQLNRGVEMREDKRPILSDLRQSGNLEEDADLVIGLYRDVMYNKKTADKALMELLILKQRNGPIGMLPLSFAVECTKVVDKL